MKTIFQVRFLLLTIGVLLLALYVQHHPLGRLSAGKSLGCPIEVARSVDYYPTLFWLLLQFLTAASLVPGGIGFLDCTVLRRRHPAYLVSVAHPTLPAVLVWWAWGLLIELLYGTVTSSLSEGEHQGLQLASGSPVWLDFDSSPVRLL